MHHPFSTPTNSISNVGSLAIVREVLLVSVEHSPAYTTLLDRLAPSEIDLCMQSRCLSNRAPLTRALGGVGKELRG